LVFVQTLIISPHVFNNWYQSQGHEFDSQWVIVEGEIVAGGINCPEAEVEWAESQSNHGT